MIAMQMGDEDCLNRIGIDSEFSDGDHGRSATINEKCSVLMLNKETCIESASAAESISRTEKLKFHPAPPDLIDPRRDQSTEDV